MAERFRPYAAVFVLLKRNDEVLYLERANTGWQDGKLTFPSGHIEDGETLAQSALRELEEETGIVADESMLEQVHVMYRRNSDRTYFDVYFACEGWSGEPKNTEPTKCAGLTWLKADGVPSNIIPEVAAALPYIRTGQPFSDMKL